MKTKILTSAIIVSLLFSCSNNNKDFDATGTFEATEITISSEAAGKLIKFDISEGDSVIANKNYGVVDTTQLYLSKLLLMKNSKSILSNRPDISVQIESLREEIAKQKTEQQRIIRLLKANAATQKQLDDVNSYMAVLEGKLKAMVSTLNNNTQSIDAQSSAVDMQIAQIVDKINKSYITSPITGIVIEKFSEQGELVGIGTPLFKVADCKNIFLRAYVTSDQLSQIKLGDKVNVIADFGGDNLKNYEGRISWIAQKSEFTPKGIQTPKDRANLVYAIKIAVVNDGVIKLGMYGEVKFK